MDQQGFTNASLIILLIIAVILVGLVVYFAFVQKPTTPPASVQTFPPSTGQPEESTIQSPDTRNEVAGWKTYQNTKYGFEMKYPKEWNIDIGGATSDIVHWSVSDKGRQAPWVMNLTVSERNGKTIRQWIAREDFPYEEVKAIEVEGIEGIIVRDPVTMGSDYYIAFFPAKNYMFSIGIASSPPKISGNPVNVLSQILSTFKFIR